MKHLLLVLVSVVVVGCSSSDLYTRPIYPQPDFYYNPYYHPCYNTFSTKPIDRSTYGGRVVWLNSIPYGYDQLRDVWCPLR